MSNFTQTSGAINVGIVGAGQLARMMGECAHDVGVRVTVLALTPSDAAVATCDEVVIGEPTDARALDQLARAVDVVTFDHELVDLDQIEGLERRGVVVRPSAKALRYAVDKAHQRRALSVAGLPVPRDRPAVEARGVEAAEDLGAALHGLDLEVLFPHRAVAKLPRQPRLEQVRRLQDVTVGRDNEFPLTHALGLSR